MLVTTGKGYRANSKIQEDGLKFLKFFSSEYFDAGFFDPQYRGVLDKLKFGNEGKGRGVERSKLESMEKQTIKLFINELFRVIKPSGHLFLWVDKFHLCEGIQPWIDDNFFRIVDLVTWDKGKFGMGFRTRRQCEYLVILQKPPLKAKGVWLKHDIPDVITEKIINKRHTHQKPVGLQARLIEAVTSEQGTIIDPAAGGYSVLESCLKTKRTFFGCDIL